MLLIKIYFKLKRKFFYFRHKFYPEQLKQLVDSTLYFEKNPRFDIDYKNEIGKMFGEKSGV